MRLDVGAVLFDIDGTLIDSTPAVVRAWTTWADRYGLDVGEILAVSHGRRSVDVVAMFVPASEHERAFALMSELEYDGLDTIVALPGASQLLSEIPEGRWAAVTSGPADLMRRRLSAAGLEVPAVLVGAGDVVAGKPDPEGYRKAAGVLGVDVAECAVIEDAPAGIAAGRAAGAVVVGVATSHEVVELARADVVLPDLTHCRASVDGGRLRLDLSVPLTS